MTHSVYQQAACLVALAALTVSAVVLQRSNRKTNHDGQQVTVQIKRGEATETGPLGLVAKNPIAEDSIQYASIRGRIVLKGDWTPLAPLIRKGDTTAKDAEVCACEDVPDERLVVDPDTRGVRDVFVYLAPKQVHTLSYIHPTLNKPGPIELHTKACRYTPHALIAQVGQQINQVNDDALGHHLAIRSPRSRQFSAVVPSQHEISSFSFREPERCPILVVCDFHTWMKAYILPLDHPYGAVTNANGEFLIDKIPVGAHKLAIWHNGESAQRAMKIELPVDGIDFGDLSVTADKNAIALTKDSDLKLQAITP